MRHLLAIAALSAAAPSLAENGDISAHYVVQNGSTTVASGTDQLLGGAFGAVATSGSGFSAAARGAPRRYRASSSRTATPLAGDSAGASGSVQRNWTVTANRTADVFLMFGHRTTVGLGAPRSAAERAQLGAAALAGAAPGEARWADGAAAENVFAIQVQNPVHSTFSSMAVSSGAYDLQKWRLVDGGPSDESLRYAGFYTSGQYTLLNSSATFEGGGGFGLAPSFTRTSRQLFMFSVTAGDALTFTTSTACASSLTASYVAGRLGDFAPDCALDVRWGGLAAAFDIDGAPVAGLTLLGEDGIDYALGSAVPEPSTWALMIVGFGLVGLNARRRVRVV